MPAMHSNHRRSVNLHNLGLANQKLAHQLGAGHWIAAEADVRSAEGELANRADEHLRLLQDTKIADAKLQNEFAAIDKELGAAASKLRVLHPPSSAS